ncbi:hypothetical protein ANRL4_02381 [Anaerolineae bacterium]|nr:hypothetical protein ANRL4_02381 [Anaerolineae bacterium]
MATSTELTTHRSEARTASDRLPAPTLNLRRFDWSVTVLSFWFMLGLFLDGWAHTHGQADETFFTPWHAVLYSGQLAVTAYLFLAFIRNVARGYVWRESLPAGYGLSLIGGILFAIGGLGDLIWHTLFGIEQSVEALFSPTHLLLALAGMLIVSGPLRAAWQRVDALAPRLVDQLPAILSAALLLSFLTFFTQIAYPLANLWGIGASQASWQAKEQGVISFLLDTAIYMGVLLLLIRRWTLAPGAISLIFGINAVAMGFLFDGGPYPIMPVITRILAGIIIDFMYQRLRPSAQRLSSLRVFAFVAPLIVGSLYFLSGQMLAGIAWSIHLWAGSIVMAGVVGLLISNVSAPPQITSETVH